MKKSITFFTIASNLYMPHAEKMINSFKKFSNEKMFLFGQKDIDKAGKQGYKMGWLYPYFGAKLAKDYDLVVQIEADSIVCGELTEIINLNNKEVGVAKNNYNSITGLSTNEMSRPFYVSSGLVASGNLEFWETWRNKARSYAHNYQFVEQDVLNYVLAYNNFDIHYLDKEDVFYGSSLRKVWKDMYMEEDKIMCADRQIKVLHWAGGIKGKMDWWGYKFDKKVCERLDYLTK